MSIRTLRVLRLLTLFAPLTALLIAAPTPAAEAVGATGATWQAWGLTVDFPNEQHRVVYTAYIGRSLPEPTVVASKTLDISTECMIDSPTGQLDFDGEYAIFDSNTSIRCNLPSWRNQILAMDPDLPGGHADVLTCQAGESPFFVAADVRLDAKPSTNPLLDARRLGLSFSVPTDGTNARTVVGLSTGGYQSPGWTVRTKLGNRMLMGMNGPTLVAIADHFGWLSFLTAPAWESYFTSTITGPRMGHWVEPSMASSQQAATPFGLRTRRAVVYIGYNSATGDHFLGKLRRLETDPGCYSD